MFVKIERLLQMFSRRIPFFRAISTENSEIHDGSEYNSLCNRHFVLADTSRRIPLPNGFGWRLELQMNRLIASHSRSSPPKCDDRHSADKAA